MTRREGLAWALLAAYGVVGYVYGQTFRNEVTVWAHAVTRAPMKPRPRVQYALALMEQRRFEDAAMQLDTLSAILAESTHVRSFDLARGAQALHDNRALLSRLTEAP